MLQEDYIISFDITCELFQEFLGILSKVSRGTIQEKLQWIFGLYDLNGDGLITKKEMLDVVTSIYEMLGHNTEPQVEENSAKEHVERIFHVNTFPLPYLNKLFNKTHTHKHRTFLLFLACLFVTLE